MKIRDSISIIAIILLVLSSLFSCFMVAGEDTSTRQIGVDYDSLMLDPIDDVKKIGSSDILTSASGFDDIDIVRLKSYQPVGELGGIIELELTIEVTVSGLISDMNDIYYMIFIDADSKDYLITYNNGSAEGQSLEDALGLSFNVEAEGAGTDTLMLTFNILNLENPRESFGWNSLGMVLSDEKFQYLDKAPDKLIKATAPTDQATVFGNITVEGIVEESIVDIQSVEYQIDSKFDGAWDLAVNDSGTDWLKWSFEFDTTRLKDNTSHQFHFRGYDGERYHEDAITLYIVQSSRDNPARIDSLPDVNTGDIFDYTSTQDPSYFGIEIELITDLTETIAGYETVEVDGESYEVWIRKLEGDGVITVANIPIDFTMVGETLITTDKYSELKNEQDTRINVPLLGSIEEKSTSFYDPPLNAYDFPMVITETWSSKSSVSTTTFVRFSGDSAEDSSENDVEYIFEALHTEQTEVPAGTYSTFVIRSQQLGSDVYTLNYYSHDLGNVVRTESYDNNRELLDRIELTDFTLGRGGFIKIQDVQLTPPQPRVDDKVKIKVDVINTGTVNLRNNEIVLEIDGRQYKSELVDIDAQATFQLSFTWTPDDEGEHTVTVLTPDESWTGTTDVAEAEGSNIQGLFSSPTNLFILIIVILVIVVLAVGIRKRRSSKEPEMYYQEQPGPSVFDDSAPQPVYQLKRPGEVQGTQAGPPDEPEVRVIKYTGGMAQVGGRTVDNKGRNKEE